MHLRAFPWNVVLAPDNRIREEGTPTEAVEAGTKEMKEGFGGGGKGVSGGGGGSVGTGGGTGVAGPGGGPQAGINSPSPDIQAGTGSLPLGSGRSVGGTEGGTTEESIGGSAGKPSGDRG